MKTLIFMGVQLSAIAYLLYAYPDLSWAIGALTRTVGAQ